MKRNWKSILCAISEYTVLIAPTAGYSIYCYHDTLQYTMSAESKGMFWSLIGAALILSVLFKIFRKKYDRYVAGYVQQKTDLETRPEDERLINKVAEKESIIENIDYLVAAIPVAILLTVLAAFQSAISQLMIILELLIGSLMAKIGLHSLTVYFEKSGMLKAIKPKE